uniref:Uncharacterized protein n=1 Tax=Parascaris equorum TaxID=6256 RepID=A0A914RW22_PAREQ
MRLLVRFALAVCAVIILLIWLGMSQAVNNERNDPETGIIVVAVTLDPTMADNESDDDELEETKTTSLSVFQLWHPGISSPSGRLLPQFDTLTRLQSLSDVTVA